MRNFIILFASVLMALPAHASKEISREDFEAKVRSTGRLLTPKINIVYPNGKTSSLSVRDFFAFPASDILGGTFGRIHISDQNYRYTFYNNGRNDYRVLIQTRTYWQATLTYEAIMELLATHHRVTFFMGYALSSGFDMYSVNHYANYGFNDVEVQIDDLPRVKLHDVMKAYQKRQELESGRYIGTSAKLRKLGKMILSQPIQRSCERIFVSTVR